jgi:hypothetical protein
MEMNWGEVVQQMATQLQQQQAQMQQQQQQQAQMQQQQQQAQMQQQEATAALTAQLLDLMSAMRAQPQPQPQQQQQQQQQQQHTAAIRGPTFRPAAPMPFSGDGKTAGDISMWLFSLEAYFIQFEAEDGNTFRLRQVTGFLRPPALEWWQLRSAQAAQGADPLPTTWAAFREEILKVYRPVDAEQRDRSAFSNIRQTGTVEAYIVKYHALLLRVPDISIKEQVHRFTEGLKQPTIVHVRLMRPETLRQAMEFAARADSSATPGRANLGRPAGGTPMELGAIDDGDDDDGDEIAAIAVRAPVRASGAAKGGGRGRPATAVARPAGVPKMTDAIRAECIRLGLCFRCRKAGHRTGDCTAFNAVHPNA